MSQKWEDCLEHAVLERAKTSTAPPSPSRSDVSFSPFLPLCGGMGGQWLWGRRARAVSGGHPLRYVFFPPAPPHYSSSVMCEMKCGVPPRAICILTMAEILSQRKSGLIVEYETIENKLGWPESFRERESFKDKGLSAHESNVVDRSKRASGPGPGPGCSLCLNTLPPFQQGTLPHTFQVFVCLSLFYPDPCWPPYLTW